MPEGMFKYEDCLLKHHVRVNGWLPVCKNRRKQINAGAQTKHHRRLRYFTFCAVGAIDVLMLDVARVVRQSQQGTFDTIFFFDKDSELVVETQKRIPGAVGFVGDFLDTVLDVTPSHQDPLSAQLAEPDTAELRELQRRQEEQRLFVGSFPFDVINLDLEGFLFVPNDPIPGRLVNALRRIFAWQRAPLRIEKRAPAPIDGFSLMFTTPVGPPNLTADYLSMLRDSLTNNLNVDPELRPVMIKRAGLDDVAALQASSFDTFFKLAMPKVLASILMEEDWYIDSEAGIKLYEFERPAGAGTGTYKMLHVVTDVKRQSPTRENRPPGAESSVARQAYRAVVRQTFATPELPVSMASIDVESVQKNLDIIKARRRKYYQGA